MSNESTDIELIEWEKRQHASITIDHAKTDARLERIGRIRRLILGLLSRLRTKTGRKFDSW